MSEAVRFLHALAQALSTLALYSPGHPATHRAIETAWQALATLLAKDPQAVFLFLGSAPVYDGRALHELGNWPWSARLAQAGVQRVEFDSRATPAGMTLLLERLTARLASGAPEVGTVETALDGIAYGPVAVQEVRLAIDETATTTETPVEGSQELSLHLQDELEVMGYVLTEARAGRVARAEAEAIVRILATHLDIHALPQAASPPDEAAYHAVHAVNTALLTMAAATVAGVDRPSRQRIGLAALFHDVGMARLPEALLRREQLNDVERAQVETHVQLGAELLLGVGGRGIELAAAVAWEHHLRPDGTGYPKQRVRMPPHWVSKMVGVAGTYVALRSPRPFRAAWTPARALGYLAEGAGTVFDRESAMLIAGLVRPTSS